MPEGRIYLGIAYLSSVLKREGHEVSLVHVVAPPEREEFVHRVAKSRPDLVGFSSTTHMFRHVAKWAGWLREDNRVTTVCGGVHPTISPDEVIGTTGIDIACRGEAEHSMVELCGALQDDRDYRRIPGFWVDHGGEVFKNPARALVTDLDSFPFPDRTIFDRSLFCDDQHPRGTLMASRGCPFNCSYCSNHAQRSVYPNPGDYVRFRSPENVVAEIEQMLEEDDRIEFIRFDDDILTIDREWLGRLSVLYRERIRMPFICNSRVNFMDRRLAGSLKEMGCSVVCMGIESGNPGLRSEVLNRQMSNERIVSAFEACREAGIKTVSTNMVGLPFEDVSMVLDTIKLNSRCRPDTMQVSTFVPYPGTDLFKLCEQAGLLSSQRVDSIFYTASTLDIREPGWEPEAARSAFRELSYLYGLAYRLPWHPLRKAAVGAIDSLLLSTRLPGGARRRAFDRLLGWAGSRYRPEWIKY